MLALFCRFPTAISLPTPPFELEIAKYSLQFFQTFPGEPHLLLSFPKAKFPPSFPPPFPFSLKGMIKGRVFPQRRKSAFPSRTLVTFLPPSFLRGLMRTMPSLNTFVVGDTDSFFSPPSPGLFSPPSFNFSTKFFLSFLPLSPVFFSFFLCSLLARPPTRFFPTA